jgi:hypothetical protein
MHEMTKNQNFHFDHEIEFYCIICLDFAFHKNKKKRNIEPRRMRRGQRGGGGGGGRNFRLRSKVFSSAFLGKEQNLEDGDKIILHQSVLDGLSKSRLVCAGDTTRCIVL